MKTLPDGILDQAVLLARGAGGHLSRAYERYIRIDKIDGLEPRPDATEQDPYVLGREITQPIEVVYSRSDDLYYLYAGNHRITQAMLNKQSYVLAFVEPDGGKIGPDAVRTPPTGASPDSYKTAKKSTPSMR